MKYHIIFPADKRYVYTKISGLLDAATMLACILEAYRIARQEGVNRHLLDLTEARNPLIHPGKLSLCL